MSDCVVLLDESYVMAKVGLRVVRDFLGKIDVYGVNNIRGLHKCNMLEKEHMFTGEYDYKPKGNSLFIKGAVGIMKKDYKKFFLICGWGDNEKKDELRKLITKAYNIGKEVWFFGNSMGAIRFGERIGVKKDHICVYDAANPASIEIMLGSIKGLCEL